LDLDKFVGIDELVQQPADDEAIDRDLHWYYGDLDKRIENAKLKNNLDCGYMKLDQNLSNTA